MKRHIPNIITCLNLLSGVCACIAALKGRQDAALVLLIACGIFDFLDGFSARLLGAYSNIGRELDSLADVVSFGVAPSLVLYDWCSALFPSEFSFLTFVPLVIAPFSGYRLAKFNLDERQTSSFLGLPTPANALLTVSAVAFAATNPSGTFAAFLSEVWVVPAFSLLLSVLLISEMPMFSLKFKSLSLRQNAVRFTYLALCIITVVTGMATGLDWKFITFSVFALYIVICSLLCLLGLLRNSGRK